VSCDGSAGQMPTLDWRDGRGVQGGWDCVVSGDCSFLSGGEERGWRFAGDESFHPPSVAVAESRSLAAGLSDKTGGDGTDETVPRRGSRL